MILSDNVNNFPQYSDLHSLKKNKPKQTNKQTNKQTKNPAFCLQFWNLLDFPMKTNSTMHMELGLVPVSLSVISSAAHFYMVAVHNTAP